MPPIIGHKRRQRCEIQLQLIAEARDHLTIGSIIFIYAKVESSCQPEEVFGSETMTNFKPLGIGWQIPRSD